MVSVLAISVKSVGGDIVFLDDLSPPRFLAAHIGVELRWRAGADDQPLVLGPLAECFGLGSLLGGGIQLGDYLRRGAGRRVQSIPTLGRISGYAALRYRWDAGQCRRSLGRGHTQGAQLSALEKGC